MKVALFFGGPGAEKYISFDSAKNIYQILSHQTRNNKGYEITPVLVDNKKRWKKITEKQLIENTLEQLLNSSNPTFTRAELKENTIAFPMIHGEYGEDGQIQNIFQSEGVAYVGSDSESSKLCYDKELLKKEIIRNDIMVPRFKAYDFNDPLDYPLDDYETIIEVLGKIIFVKPARQGSSLGVSKVSSKSEYEKAIEKAQKYDSKIIIEEYLGKRELEILITGNENLKISGPTEIIPKNKFYDFESKYSENGCLFNFNPRLNAYQKRVRHIAARAYKALGCSGYARADFFIQKDRIYFNEINTVPGFTDTSLIPLLWDNQGRNKGNIIAKLIDLGLTRE